MIKTYTIAAALLQVLISFSARPSYAEQSQFLVSSPAQFTRLFYNTQQLVTSSYKAIGIDIKWRMVPAERSLMLSNTGKVDAEFLRVANITDYAPNLVRVDVPIGKKSASVYGRPNLIFESRSDLANLRMVGVHGKKGYSQFAEQLEAELHLVQTEVMALRMIEKDRADFTLLFDDEAEALIQQASVESKVVRIGHFIDIELYHFIHEKHASLAPILEDQFRKQITQAAPAND